MEIQPILNWLGSNKKKTFWVTVLVLLVAYFFWPYSLRIHGTMPKNEKFKFLIQFSTDTPIPLLCQDYSFGNNIWKSRVWNTDVEVQPDPVTGAFDVDISLRKPGGFCRWSTDASVSVYLINNDDNPLLSVLTPQKEIKEQTQVVVCKRVIIAKYPTGENIYCYANGSPVVKDNDLFPSHTSLFYDEDKRDIELNFLFEDNVLHFDTFPEFQEVWGDK